MSKFADVDLSTNGKVFEPIPAGAYPARCYSVVDLGTHEVEFNGEKKSQRKIRITWELPTEMKIFSEEKGEQPCVIGKEYTFSMHEKSSFRQMLEGWRGKKFSEEEAQVFDEEKILGKTCAVNISHVVGKNGNTYASLTGVSQLMKGVVVPDQINPSAVFCLSTKEFDEETFDRLPKFLQEKISLSPEYKKFFGEEDGISSEIPVIQYESGIKPEDLPF